VYDSIQEYVERRFEQLERERPGKGFVMTVYRRRAASSPLALRRSLERRRSGLELVARGAAADSADDLEASDQQDIDELLGGGLEVFVCHRHFLKTPLWPDTSCEMSSGYSNA